MFLTFGLEGCSDGNMVATDIKSKKLCVNLSCGGEDGIYSYAAQDSLEALTCPANVTSSRAEEGRNACPIEVIDRDAYLINARGRYVLTDMHLLLCVHKHPYPAC